VIISSVALAVAVKHLIYTEGNDIDLENNDCITTVVITLIAVAGPVS
jgi:hypothetical protein